MIRAFLVCALVASATAAHADIACSDWLTDPSNEYHKSYAWGFGEAFGLALAYQHQRQGAVFGRERGMFSREALAHWVTNYCTRNPTDLVGTGIIHLTGTLVRALPDKPAAQPTRVEPQS
jgi:hypothetical protein